MDLGRALADMMMAALAVVLVVGVVLTAASFFLGFLFGGA